MATISLEKKKKMKRRKDYHPKNEPVTEESIASYPYNSFTNPCMAPRWLVNSKVGR